MEPQTEAEARRKIQYETLSEWRNIHLFDSKYSEKTDSLFASPADSRRNGFFDDWRPGTNRPLFYNFDRWQKFRPGNRLFLAIDYWRRFPVYLRENVDQRAERFPELARAYGNRNSGLDRMYHFAHENVIQYLIDVAEANDIDGAGEISVAGFLCRELLKDRDTRQKLWGQMFVISNWPDCHPNLLELEPDVRVGILRGNGVVARLESLLTRWRHETGQPIPPKPVWKNETRELTFEGKLIRKVDMKAKWTPILSSFQEDDWHPTIDNPLPPNTDVSECLKSLNKGLKSIRFMKEVDTIRWIDRRVPRHK